MRVRIRRASPSGTYRHAWSRALLAGGACALSLSSLACDSRSRTREIETSRVHEVAGEGVQWRATSAERFGMRMPGATQPSAAFKWDTPPNWSDLAPSSMRQANFQVAGDENTECYLTLLPGDAGGLEANVNRWRRQMSLAPLGPEEIAALPRGEMFGEAAVLVDFEGTFTGMSGDQDGAQYRMVGLLQMGSQGSRFLKLVGPGRTVGDELGNFHELARSFRESAGERPIAAHGTDTRPVRTESTGGEAQEDGGGGFDWQTPAGWQRGPERQMRAATYHVGGDESAECYVSILGGHAGGPLANINRWRDQMGQGQISTAEFAELERIPMLGTEAVIVEIAGDYSGMSGENATGAYMLGAVCGLADRAVFVKMVGPRGSVEPERQAFLEFCKSMTEAR